MEQIDTASAKPTASPLNAVMVVIALVPVIAVLIGLATLVGVVDFLFAGFLFILYWAGVKGKSPKEFTPALMGSLGGLGLAYSIYILPTVLGAAGAIVTAAAVAFSVYLLVRGQLPMLINNAFMLLLTVGTSLAFKADVHYAAAALSIVLAASYSGGLALIGRAFSARASKRLARASTE